MRLKVLGFCAVALIAAPWLGAAQQVPAAAATRATSPEDRFAELMGQLGAGRSGLVLYQAEHAQNFPALAMMSDWTALVEATYADGHTGPNGSFGPYIRGIPLNPLTGSTRVVARGSPAANAGWTYDDRTGKIRAIVPAADAALAARFLLPGDYELLKTAPPR